MQRAYHSAPDRKVAFVPPDSKSQLFCLAFLVLFSALTVRPVLAHGGGTPQLVNEDIGSYWISVWTSPDPARVGELHITVAVSEPGTGRESGEPVLGATVQIKMSSVAEDAVPIHVLATNEQAANKLFYEADVAIPVAGEWVAEINVEGPAGSGSAAFALDVRPSRNNNWTLVGAAGIVALAAVYMIVQLRRKRSNVG